MKRSLSVILAVIMLAASFSMISFSVSAATTPVADIVNLFAPDKVYNAEAHSNTNKYPEGLGTNVNYYCTEDKIKVTAGDKFYFFGDSSIGYHVTLYDLNGNGYGDTDKKVTPAELTVVDSLAGNYKIYSYTVPSNIGYIRISQRAAAYNTGAVLVTKNQPFDKATYYAWCVRNGGNPDALVGATASITNLFSFVSYGTPNTTTAGGEVTATANYHFATGKTIDVKAGDVIRIGPCLDEQTFQMMAYNGTKGIQVNTNSANVRTTRFYKQSNLFIMEYTVPSGITSVTPVCSQMVKELYIATKNQELTEAICKSYWSIKGFDATKLIGGSKTTSVNDIVNLFSDKTGGMGIHGTEGKYTGTDGFGTNTSYRSTENKIQMTQNDVIYFVGNSKIAHQLSLFKSDNSGICNVGHNYLIQYANLGNGYYIYAYRVREDAAWLRLSEYKTDYDAGLILATKNQPFDEATYRAWCAANSVNPDAYIGEETGINNLFVFKGYGTPNETTCDGDIKSNLHFSTGNAIAVKEGDVITIAPIVENQTFQAVAFKTDGTSERIKATSAGVTVTPVSEYGTNLMIMKYTVPAGVTHIVPVGSQMHKDFYVVTKNREFDPDELKTYYINEGLDPETIICGADTTALKNIYNLFTPSAGIVNAPGMWGKNNNGVKTYYDHTKGYGSSAKYWCTDSIPMQAGDVVYFVGVDNISYHITVFGTDGKGIEADVKPNTPYLPIYAKLDNGYYIYAYHAPSNVGYIRVSQFAEHYNTGSILVTKNQPFSIETYEAWALANSAIVPDVDSKVYGKSALFIGDSITYGKGEADVGETRLAWAGRLAKLYGMKVLNAGDSGARVSQTGTAGFIIDHLDDWTDATAPDMVVMHGGVNDARYEIPVGTLNSTDVTTYGGGLNAMFKKAKQLYPNADLFYIANFTIKENKGNVQNMTPYFTLGKQICDKYGVTFINLYDNKELNDALWVKEGSSYPYMPDLLHPNAAGYNIITPYIAEALELYYDPIKAPDLTNASLSLGSDLTMKFHVTLDERMEAPTEGELTLKVTMGGKSTNITKFSVVDGKYVFAFDGISPERMTEPMDVEVYYKGTKADEKLDYTVRENAQAMLTQYASNQKLVRLVTDMLYYGAAAQKYRGYMEDDLATKGVSGMYAELDPLFGENHKNIVNNGEVNGVYFIQAGVRFENVNKIYIKLSSYEGAKIVVKLDGNTVATYENMTSTVYTGAISASNFSKVYTFELYDNGVLVQTLTYSISAYCHSMQNSVTPYMKELGTALYNYGCSAAEYNK